MARPLDSFPALEVDGVRVWVDQVRPVAVLQRTGAPEQVVGWHDLFTGWAEPAVAVVAAPHGVWVHYGLLNSVDRGPLAAAVDVVDAPVVHIDVATGATAVVRVGLDQVLGATRHGLWTTSHSTAGPDHEHPYSGGILPDDWHEDTPVTIRSPDGSRRHVTVDRPVLAVDETDQHVRLLVHASPPIAIPGERGSTSYTYRPTDLLLPADRPLPDRVRFRDLIPLGWGVPADLAERRGPMRAAGIPPVPTGAPDADGEWTVLDLPADLRRQGVEFIVSQLPHLEHYWNPEGGGPAHALSAGLHDVAVTVEDAYPRTRVVLTFRHPAYPGGRMRRSHPVHDSAGRLHVDDSLAIWLMEDLDTRDLPPLDAAVDGILDI